MSHYLTICSETPGWEVVKRQDKGATKIFQKNFSRRIEKSNPKREREGVYQSTSPDISVRIGFDLRDILTISPNSSVETANNHGRKRSQFSRTKEVSEILVEIELVQINRRDNCDKL